MVMKTINASKFKEQCLSLLENLDPEGIVITKHGKPLARLIPANSDCADLIGSMKGKIKVHGDILSTGLKWDAES
jgi:prevent-host-death family protein